MEEARPARPVRSADAEAGRAEEIRDLDFAARFGALRPRLTAVCATVVGPDDAPDLVHDTYIRARQRLEQLRDPARFDAWVVRIALNEAKSVMRRRRLGSERLRAVRPHRVDAPDLGLAELVERLAPRERAVLVLHYGYGYQMSEIARLIGLTEINVRTIAFRARRTLRAQLEEAER